MTGPGARVHEVLSVPSRVAVLDWLRASAEPLDAHQLAAQAGLHVSTVRSHLAALMGAGMVTWQSQQTGGRGRPHITYTALWAAEPKAGPYQELAGLLAAHLADATALREQPAEQAGEDWVQRRLHPSRPQAHPAPTQAQALALALAFRRG